MQLIVVENYILQTVQVATGPPTGTLTKLYLWWGSVSLHRYVRNQSVSTAHYMVIRNNLYCYGFHIRLCPDGFNRWYKTYSVFKSSLPTWSDRFAGSSHFLPYMNVQFPLLRKSLHWCVLSIRLVCKRDAMFEPDRIRFSQIVQWLLHLTVWSFLSSPISGLGRPLETTDVVSSILDRCRIWANVSKRLYADHFFEVVHDGRSVRQSWNQFLNDSSCSCFIFWMLV